MKAGERGVQSELAVWQILSGNSLQLYLGRKYDTPEKTNTLAANMDTFFAQLRRPSTMLKLPLEAKAVPFDNTPVLYLQLSRLSFAADASIKGPVAKWRVVC